MGNDLTREHQQSTDSGRRKTSWTIMLYIAADGILANFAVESLKQLNKSAQYSSG